MPPDESDREHTGRTRVLAVQRNAADSKAAGVILQLNFAGATCPPALRSCPLRQAPASKPCVAGPPAAAAVLRRATLSAAPRTPAAVSWALTRCPLPCLCTTCCTISCAALVGRDTKHAPGAISGEQRLAKSSSRGGPVPLARSKSDPAPVPRPVHPRLRLSPPSALPSALAKDENLQKTALLLFVRFTKTKTKLGFSKGDDGTAVSTSACSACGRRRQRARVGAHYHAGPGKRMHAHAPAEAGQPRACRACISVCACADGGVSRQTPVALWGGRHGAQRPLAPAGVSPRYFACPCAPTPVACARAHTHTLAPDGGATPS